MKFLSVYDDPLVGKRRFGLNLNGTVNKNMVQGRNVGTGQGVA
jgi:hypothetical protein